MVFRTVTKGRGLVHFFAEGKRIFPLKTRLIMLIKTALTFKEDKMEKITKWGGL